MGAKGRLGSSGFVFAVTKPFGKSIIASIRCRVYMRANRNLNHHFVTQPVGAIECFKTVTRLLQWQYMAHHVGKG